MKQIVTIVTCDETGCRHSSRPPYAQWSVLAGADVCPRCTERRRAAAQAALDLLTAPLPRLKPDVPARGAQRRIQALVAAGWSLELVRRGLDLSGQGLGCLLRAATVAPVTHARVATLFERLWNVEPPQADDAQVRAVRAARLHAAEHGWVAAMAWDDIDADEHPAEPDGLETLDEMAVERAISGERPTLHAAERRAAVRVLHARRWSDRRIAAHLGVVDRTVLRDREELGLAAFPHGELVFERRTA